MHNHFLPSSHIPLTWASIPYFIWDMIETAWPTKNVVFTQEHPREESRGPIIVWRLQRRVPGIDGVEANKHRQRSSDKFADGTIIETFAQKHTCLYQFDLYDLSNEAVNQLAVDFEELMFAIRPFLMEIGVERWLFSEQLSDNLNTDTRRDSGASRASETQDLFSRSLVYHCIYEQKIRRAPALVGSILLKLNGREQQVVAEPLVHGSVDILDNPYAARILYISDDEVLPDIVYDPSQGYVAGIDYTLELGDSGESQIVWADAGKQPDIGSTVYVTYTYRALITGGNLRLKE